MTHLWEPKHSYYCAEDNYFGGQCHSEFRSWQAFLEEEGNADLDYNLLFRWDWDRKEKTLTLFWVGQRKGLFRSTTINAMHPDEEPSVRAWLEWRWHHLQSLWAPLSGVERSENVSNDAMPLAVTVLLPGTGDRDG